MKYKKVSKMNELCSLAKQLSVDFRCSQLGMSVLSENSEDTKFLPLDYIYLNYNECVKYIKSVAHPSLQTKFI